MHSYLRDDCKEEEYENERIENAVHRYKTD